MQSSFTNHAGMARSLHTGVERWIEMYVAVSTTLDDYLRSKGSRDTSVEFWSVRLKHGDVELRGSADLWSLPPS